MWFQQRIQILTEGRGTYDVTSEIGRIVKESGVRVGLCHIFIQHTSASIVMTENADSDMRHDMELFFRDLVPDADRRYVHVAEGPDDMSAHVRTILTESSLSLPIGKGKPLLGVWQGVYIWEHRTSAHNRTIIITINGSN